MNMASSLVFLCGFVMMFFVFPWVSPTEVQVKSTKNECEKFIQIACPCGLKGEDIMVHVKLCSVKDKYTGKTICLPCVGDNYKEVHCNKFKNCETCVAGMNKCFTCPPGKTGPFCNEKQNFNMYPINIRIPRGGYLPHEKKRYIRDFPDGCAIPDSMETVEIDCTIWPTHVKCKEICIFGYTFQNGPTRELLCVYEENEWKPSYFSECIAYLDCRIHLKYAGDMVCTSGRMKSGPTCDIICLAYDEHEMVPKMQYECKGDGTWEPSLPFCVERGEEPNVAPPGQTQT